MPVAFTVLMSDNMTGTPEGVPVVFDEVITNVGNAFNVNESQFECPNNDYYLFTWGAAAEYGGGHTRLYQNGAQVTRMYLTRQNSDRDSGTSGSSTTSTIVKCSVGSHFYIVVEAGQDDTIFLGGHTTFSGYKVPGQ